MKTLVIYLQQIRRDNGKTVFTDGVNEIIIPDTAIVSKRKIIKKEYAVIVPAKWAKEEGIA